VGVPQTSGVFSSRFNTDVSSVRVQPQAFKVHYNANGTGRDTYIERNSGGFFAPNASISG
jgi:hypothetical protein